jgi:membrane-bound ClpP family serine protease
VTATLEWTGALLGLLGAYLIATHGRWARFGWLAFLGANAAMAGFALATDAYGLLLQQLGFTGSALLGLRRAWRAPALPGSDVRCRCAQAQPRHHGP